MTASNADRLQEQIERVLSLMLPRAIAGQLAVFASWEYLVVTATPAVPGVTPALVSGVPVDPVRCPFGELAGIPVWPGPSGSPCVPAVGSRVLLAFHDGNPAKPAIVGVDPLVPAVLPPVPGVTKLSVAQAVATFATGLNGTTLTAQATALLTNLAPLL